MSTPQNLESPPNLSAISEQQVEEFLRDNPDFFAGHTSLLSSLQVPHPSGSAVSLIERQVSALREQNSAYKRKLMELVQVGRDNDKVNRNLHALSLTLFRTRSVSEVVEVLFDALATDFSATRTGLRLAGLDDNVTLPENVQIYSGDDPQLDAFRSFLRAARPACNPLKPEQLDYLFGDHAQTIGSTALVPLGTGGRAGILAIGSDDPQRFHPGMDTLFLSNLGDLASAALERWLNIPENNAN